MFPRRIFNGAIELQFEEEWFKAPVGYEEYLTIHFNDYMSLPPESERHAHACIVDVKHDYKEYVQHLDERAIKDALE